MNVYTKSEYRRRGISKRMIEILIDEAKERGVTEIGLDATEMGRPLYMALGFENNTAGMVLGLFKKYCLANGFLDKYIRLIYFMMYQFDI